MERNIGIEKQGTRKILKYMRSHAGDKKVEAQQHSKSPLDHHFTHHFTKRGGPFHRLPPVQAESMAAYFGKCAIEVNAVSDGAIEVNAVSDDDSTLPDLQVIGEGK
jgi:hypothetical protein